MGGVTALPKTDARPRILIIVQNLPVPFDRRVWLESKALNAAGYDVTVICPKGRKDPGHQVLEGVSLLKYRPYAPGGRGLGFVMEYAYSFLATLFLVFRARRQGKFAVLQACNPPDIFWPIALWLRHRDGTRFVFDHHDLCPSSMIHAFRMGAHCLGGPASAGEGDVPYGRSRCCDKRLVCRDRDAARGQAAIRRHCRSYWSGRAALATKGHG